MAKSNKKVVSKNVTKGLQKRNKSNDTIKQKASRKAFAQNVKVKMKQGKTKEQAVKESQSIQQRNK